MRTVIRKIVIGLALALFLAGIATTMLPKQTAAVSGSDFRADRIIDDSIFFDSNSMSATDVQAFLNSKVPVCSNAPCLKDFQTDMDYFAPDAYCGGVNAARKSAATIIKDVSVACGINPKVIIVLLEKEQSLVTSTAPSGYKYEYATGFCVPDGPPPPACAGTYGFANQVYYGARQYQKYAKDPGSYTFRAGQVNSIQYHPNGGCGSTNVFIQNQATAGLYNYTPYRPNAAALANLYGLGDSCSAYGNRNFWRIFGDWFGSTVTDRCNYNAPGSIVTDVSFRNFQRGIGSGNFIIYSGTSTNCIESHTWGVGFSNWQNNTATNHAVINPATAVIKYADLDGDGRDEPILLAFNSTGSSMVEFHVWDYSMRQWIVHAISNLPTSAMADISIEFADLNGDGKDEPLAISYKNTSSGMIEFHAWNAGVQSWQSHTISNLAAPLNPVNMQIRFADLNGDGRDEPMAIGLSSTGTGKIEFHVWNPGLWSWQTHIVSNADVIDVSTTDLQFADFDGDRVDNGVLIGKRSTGTGKIEFHVWNPGLHTWQGHYVSNQTIL